MNIQKRNIVYFLYFTAILLAYFMGMGITPLSMKWLINKALYLTIGLLFLTQVKRIKIILQASFLPLMFLLGYVFFYLLSVAATQPEGISLGAVVSKSVFYPIIFLIFCGLVYELDFKELLFPFFVGTLVVIALSLLPIIGYEHVYYGMDEARLGARVDAINRSLQSAGYARYSGVYLNQNTFGLVLAIGLGISLALYCDYTLRRFKYTKFQSYVIALVFISSLAFALITLSRASLLAIFIVLSVFSYKAIRSVKGLLAIIILFASVFAILYFNQEVFDLIVYRFTEQGTSSRSLIWMDALGTIANYPFTGVGEFVSFVNNRGQSAHNVYLQILADNGIFSGVCWVLWAGYYLYNSTRIVFSKSLGGDLRIPVLAGLCIGILSHQFFESQVSGALSILTFALILSMTLSYHMRKLQIEKTLRGNLVATKLLTH